VLQVIKSLNPHKDFRLWMTAEVHPKFPTILLQSSLKITFEVCSAVILALNTHLSNKHLIMALLFEVTCRKQVCIDVSASSTDAECADNACMLYIFMDTTQLFLH